MNFIHLADIHLGAVPDRGCPWSERRSEEIWDSFQKAVEDAGKTDLLLIAGDLFHHQPLLRELKEVNFLFSKIPQTQIVLTAGNHDYLKDNSYYLSFDWAENVHCLWKEELEYVYLEELDAYIYGLSYHTREIVENKYDEARTVCEEGIHILMAHGGDQKHIPISTSKLSQSEFDYIAMGHIHKPGVVVRNKMAYAGALEPLDRNDTGTHGYFYGEVTEIGTRIAFVPCACRSYYPLKIEINNNTTQLSLEEKLRKTINELGPQNIYQILLTGYCDTEVYFNYEKLKLQGHIIEILDCTKPDFDYRKLARQYEGSMIEEYITQLCREDATEIEQKALFFGVQAMLETRI